MKKFLSLLALILMSISAFAEPLSYSEVIQAEGRDKAQIYSGLREWVATHYVSGKTVTQMEDPSTGTIILNAKSRYQHGNLSRKIYDGWISYTLKLQARDGRFRVEMSSISHEQEPGKIADGNLGLITTDEKSGKGGINKIGHDKEWKEVKKETRRDFDLIVASLRQFNFNSSQEEDW